MFSGPLAEDDDDDDDGDDNNREQQRAGQAQPNEGFSDFSSKTVKGVLFKLNPVPSDDMAKVQLYIESGVMRKDFEFAYEVHAAVNFSLRRDFSSFWESPWADDHILDNNKKRRADENQKALAVSSYIKATSNQDPESADAYIANVNRMLAWEEKKDSREMVKTVSRMVLMRERAAISAMKHHDYIDRKGRVHMPIALEHLTNLGSGGVDVIAHTLRRSPKCYDTFARLVAQEILMADSSSGKRTTTVYATKMQAMAHNDAVISMLKVLDMIAPDELPPDKMGLPLLFMKHGLCVCNDVLVVNDDSTTATYVLSIEGPPGKLSLEGVDTIKISNVFTEEEYARAMAAQKPAAAADGPAQQQQKRRAVPPLTSLMPMAKR